MMFTMRAILVALGFFGVLYCLLSMLTVCLWKGAKLLRGNSDIVWARLLFAIRIFPLAAAGFMTLAFAVPAFLLLEPAAIDEDARTVVFSLCGFLLLAGGLFCVCMAQARTTRLVADLLAAPSPSLGGVAPRLPSKPGLPPLLLYGVYVPRMLVSETAVALLTSDELRVAMQHELWHMRSRDNLKKLILHGVPFPGMASLERAWQEAAEFAADEGAVANPLEALDLAAALIKISDLAPLQETPAFTTGRTNLAGVAKLRVERLLDWNEHRSPAVSLPRSCFLPFVLLSVFCIAANYTQALLLTHRFTEWLIR
jgi:hypothetical protein